MADVGTNAEKDDIFDASKYVNDPTIELLWSKQAIDHMETHYNLITSIPPQQLKLSPLDDRIYDAFIGQFPNFKLDKLEIESLKSEESKQKWRKFSEEFLSIVDDATFDTLVRIDSSKEYNEENTILEKRFIDDLEEEEFSSNSKAPSKNGPKRLRKYNLNLAEPDAEKKTTAVHY
ncbi:protein PBDC1 [Caerostris darwini]|uniref:Protein PBDC1 n=1 Tax=Caerostris darwini TaxID=1538125 RepID=A0AAV4M726_9ARAC|nr:protein PBDC1 [Caerostris darwini]